MGRAKKSPKYLRTNYIKVSLTEKEFEAIHNLSEGLDQTISGTIRELVCYGSMVGYLGFIMKELTIKYPKETEAIESILEGNKEDLNSVLDNKLTILNFKKDLMAFSSFYYEWEKTGNENGFEPITKLIEKANWNDPSLSIVREAFNKRKDTKVRKK